MLFNVNTFLYIQGITIERLPNTYGTAVNCIHDYTFQISDHLDAKAAPKCSLRKGDIEALCKSKVANASQQYAENDAKYCIKLLLTL